VRRCRYCPLRVRTAMHRLVGLCLLAGKAACDNSKWWQGSGAVDGGDTWSSSLGTRRAEEHRPGAR
jgi:hypothetical protein